MIFLSLESTSRQGFCMSKTMHLHNQHGRSTIKEDSREDLSPHYLLSSKNLTVKDEDEELTSAIMRAMKTEQSSYEKL